MANEQAAGTKRKRPAPRLGCVPGRLDARPGFRCKSLKNAWLVELVVSQVIFGFFSSKHAPSTREYQIQAQTERQ